MNQDNEIYRKLENVFKHTCFKSSLQEEAIKMAVYGSQDMFISMPTGSGKSLCYQLTAVMKKGITIVVSPLIALIQDQVVYLQSLGINAKTINSKLLMHERAEINKSILKPNPEVQLLYVTPELLATPGFQSTLVTIDNQNNLNFFAIDEAHCVSEWGHDFRPDYLKLGNLRRKFNNIRWISLTATATPCVKKDIISSLHLKEPVAVFKSECYRPNLFYDLKFKELLDNPESHLIDYIKEILNSEEHHGPAAEKGCGIIYCRTRESCNDIAMILSSNGIKSKAYHGGLNNKIRASVQKEWMDGIIPVIVATISFGMGIDKAPVRFVIHWTMPKSFEGYYQESGRAGRDGKKAYCRIYYSQQEKKQILYLLGRDAHREKKKGRTEKSDAIKKTFEALVEYCEAPSCRHGAIADYFGDKKPDCKKGCDFCLDRKSVDSLHQRWREGVVPSKITYSRTIKSTGFVQPDKTLYGGGRYGPDSRYSDDDEKGDYDKKCKEYRTKLVMQEFEKRRTKSGSSTPPYSPASNSRLRQANNLTHIPKLSVKVREYCLDLLEKALISNYETNNRSKLLAEREALNVEYDIFLENKSPQMYKLNAQKKVKEINQSTEREEIFSNTKMKPVSSIQVNNDKDSTEGKSPRMVTDLKSAGLKKASGHPSILESENHAKKLKFDILDIPVLPPLPSLSSMYSSPQVVVKKSEPNENIHSDVPVLPPLPSLSSMYTSTQLVVKMSEPNENIHPVLSPLSSVPSMYTSPQLVVKKSEPNENIHPDVPVRPPLPSVSSMYTSPQLVVKKSEPNENIHSDVPVLPTLPSVSSMYTSTQLVVKSSQPNENFPTDVDVPPLSSLSSMYTSPTQTSVNNSECNKNDHKYPDIALLPPLPPLSGMYTSLPLPLANQSELKNVHQVHLNASTKTVFSDPRISSTFIDQSASTPGVNTLLNSKEKTSSTKVLCHFENKDLNTRKNNISPLGSHSVQSEDQLTINLQHPRSTTPRDYSNPSPRKNETKCNGEKKNNKKGCADIIVRYLSPYYKSGLVQSKYMFKTLAKEMTEKLLQSLGGNVHEEKLKSTAKALVKMYFDKKKKRSSN